LLALYPDLDVMPVCADFTQPFELPEARRTVARRIVYFPGSTIGNFGPMAARRLLRRIAEQCGPGGGLVIGADLKKDSAVLERAYDDDRGVTASFNRNLLIRINRELDADFQPDQYRHHALYNADRGRVEMHLISLEDQVVTLDDAEFSFSLGETIHTESSHKYDLEGFCKLARTAGFRVHTVWTDANEMFSVQYLVTDAGDQL
jgi:dimethylhistidine N-methyltransferase